jgi:RNA polymerase I-specific transcription initiation factor RRN7
MFEEYVEDGTACGVCGSTRWRKPGFGFKYCEEGHESADYQEHHFDEEDIRHGSQKTTRAAGPEKEKVDRRMDVKVQRHLYLLAYQLVLRKQVAWLVKKKSAPRELEVCSW